MIDITSNTGEVSNYSIDPILEEIGSTCEEISSTCEDVETEKPCGGGIHGSDIEKSPETNTLQIYRDKHRMLMEANNEKDQRLEYLEKMLNDLSIQHKEGIYWLRLQLDTTRREKNGSDDRIAELQDQLRRLSSHKPPRTISLDPTISDSIGNFDAQENLVSRLEDRIEMYESSFEVMENQIAMIKSSSEEVVMTLKEEVANLMEDRTRVEMDLLNQLSELDNENRRKQLEYALELHSKDEIIETLRSRESCKISAKGQQKSSLSTAIYNGSSSTEETKSSSLLGCDIWSQANDLAIGEIPSIKDESPSSLIIRLGEEKVEMEQKLNEANKEIEDFRSRLRMKDHAELVKEKLENLRSDLSVKDNLAVVNQFSEERRAIEMTIDRLKTVMESTNAAVSNLKVLIQKAKRDGGSGPEGEKERTLSVLGSASLIHEEVKLSIFLTEVKMRNEFERLKNNHPANEVHNNDSLANQDFINNMKQIETDALIELGQAEVEYSRQVRDLEKRITSLEKPKLDDLIRKNTQKRTKKHSSKTNKTSQTPVVDELLSSFHSIRESKNGPVATGDGRMISRDILNLVEQELVQFADRLLSKNEKIIFLKEEVERHKIRENNLRKELRASIKSKTSINRSVAKVAKGTSGKSYKAINDTIEANEDENTETVFPQSVPREIHAIMTPLGDSPESHLSDPKFKGDSHRRRKGMPDISQKGGTDPVAAIKPAFSGRRCDSIGFVPSPSSSSRKLYIDLASSTTPTKGGKRRLQPNSREIKKLVFLPPCFFSDIK